MFPKMGQPPTLLRMLKYTEKEVKKLKIENVLLILGGILPAGRKTTRAPNIVCVNHIKRPWNSASFALAIRTLETDVSIASAILGPDEKPK